MDEWRLSFPGGSFVANSATGETRFSPAGGKSVYGEVQADPEYHAKAAEMGFRSAAEMACVHETLHTLLYLLAGGRAGVFAFEAGLAETSLEARHFEEAFLLLAGECLTAARKAGEGG